LELSTFLVQEKTEGSETDTELDFCFQYYWKVGSVKTLSVYIVGTEPKDPKNWMVDICPECLKFGQSKCFCASRREPGYVIAWYLKNNLASSNILTAYVSGQEAFKLFEKFTATSLAGYIDDGRKHQVIIRKFEPEIVTFIGYGFQIIDVL
jgi:hypothetical protein